MVTFTLQKPNFKKIKINKQNPRFQTLNLPRIREKEQMKVKEKSKFHAQNI